MIDVAVLAGSAVTLLAPYVAKGGEALAEKLGEEVGGQLAQLWETVKGKLGAAGKGEAVTDLEAKPDDERRKMALELQLEKVLEADPAFRDELAQLVKEIATKGGDTIKQVLNVTGDQNKTVQIGKGSGNIVNM